MSPKIQAKVSHYPYEVVAFIGRFQPFHYGHLDVLKAALLAGSHVVILVGSSFQPRTEKNPFLFEERKSMILDAVDEDDAKRITVMPLRDYKYNDQKWAAQVHATVKLGLNLREDAKMPHIALIGHTKDESTYYLKMFPQWSVIEHPQTDVIDATEIRRLLFEGKSLKYIHSAVPGNVFLHIADFVNTTTYDMLCREHHMITKYKKAWEAAPYAPTFVTSDAVVVQSGHVLMVQRKASPGEGLFALPGGFINQNEWIQDAMIRELREETKLKVPTAVLKGSIKQSKVYDAPTRSARGRTITHAYLIVLPDGSLPPVKGGDDAAKAFWIPISDIKEDECFEDHYHILQDLIGV